MRPEYFDKYAFFTGVPDSCLRPFCDYLEERFEEETARGARHIVAANEGGALALAAGYYLKTGKKPVAYLQNSGIGNMINPLISLASGGVYDIPCVFLVGWRGAPGVHDEPQHELQGRLTLPLLESVGVKTFVAKKETTEAELDEAIASAERVAIVAPPGVFEYKRKSKRKECPGLSMSREYIISRVLEYSGDCKVISTTGKASRELYELRDKRGEGHSRDFLSVGSMGHCSMIALGVSLVSDERVWCIDGDGAAIMHMGALAVTGDAAPPNLVHVVVNNMAHESVGGMRSSAASVSLSAVAEACGYEARKASNEAELESCLAEACRGDIESREKPFFIEVLSRQGSRPELGRPATSPLENKTEFMK